MSFQVSKVTRGKKKISLNLFLLKCLLVMIVMVKAGLGLS